MRAVSRPFFRRRLGARLELVDGDAFDEQLRIMIGANLADVVEQAVERVAGEGIAVEGNQAGVCGDQGRAGMEVQRRRRVDPDFVEVLERIEGLAQLVEILWRDSSLAWNSSSAASAAD